MTPRKLSEIEGVLYDNGVIEMVTFRGWRTLSPDLFELKCKHYDAWQRFFERRVAAGTHTRHVSMERTGLDDFVVIYYYVPVQHTLERVA